MTWQRVVYEVWELPDGKPPLTHGLFNSEEGAKKKCDEIAEKTWIEERRVQ